MVPRAIYGTLSCLHMSKCCSYAFPGRRGQVHLIGKHHETSLKCYKISETIFIVCLVRCRLYLPLYHFCGMLDFVTVVVNINALCDLFLGEEGSKHLGSIRRHQAVVMVRRYRHSTSQV